MANIRNRRMDDPDGINSRVFVGNLPIEADRERLKEKFECHGQVNGVMVLKGFAFVQFDAEHSAKLAIERENGSDFCGKKIDVKQAKQNNSNNSSGLQQQLGAYQQQHQHHNYKQQSWQDQQQGDVYSHTGGRGGGYSNTGGFDNFSRGNFGRGGGGDYGRGGSFPNRGGRGGIEPSWGRGYPRARGSKRGNFGGGYQGPGPGQEDFYQETEEYDERGDMERYNDRLQSEDVDQEQGGGPRAWIGMHSQAPPRPPPQSSFEKANDVEIICMDKSIRLYGEQVEARLRNMGLSVDILFPNPDIPLASVIGNIASRGGQYAVCLGLENRDHRSITLNVLQGDQQEHRNMPLDDAMTFISQNFSNRLGSAGRSQSVTANCGHPPDIQKILNFLSDDRALSMMEYDKMIKYLVVRRTALLKEEYGENIPVHLQQPPVGPHQDPASKAKQEELQERIQKILKQKQSSAFSSSNLNPSLQAAIDSLVKNGPNLLSNVSQQKSFSLASAGPAPGFYGNSQFQSGSFPQPSGQGGFSGGFGDY